jgi:hypothetical protein
MLGSIHYFVLQDILSFGGWIPLINMVPLCKITSTVLNEKAALMSVAHKYLLFLTVVIPEESDR